MFPGFYFAKKKGILGETFILFRRIYGNSPEVNSGK